MPNIKSAEKRVELSRAANAKNRTERSALKTTIKKFDAAATQGNRELADCAFKDAVKSVDKAAGSGLIHKNNAAHKKSAMAKKLNAID